MPEFQAGDILITGDLCVRGVGSSLSTDRRVGHETVGDVNETRGLGLKSGLHRTGVWGDRAPQCLQPRNQRRSPSLPVSTPLGPGRPASQGSVGPKTLRSLHAPQCRPPGQGHWASASGLCRMLLEGAAPGRKARVSICVRRRLHSPGLV